MDDILDSETWQRTMVLRMVSRPIVADNTLVGHDEVLQQQWVNSYGDTKWHDIEFEDE